MSTNPHLEAELERRLTEIETAEAADPAHATLSGRSLTAFLAVVVAVAAVAWAGTLL
ncbi:hypothetical protein [Leucobacter sp. wl10]|uniref:hypothetical protein n=1 Tax=Leucobacter sp. wl10 TaxID=2304677 RepID=UPI0013C2F64A|nr:hypothetical protein [Leucobacter sp. wl10]